MYLIEKYIRHFEDWLTHAEYVLNDIQKNNPKLCLRAYKPEFDGDDPEMSHQFSLMANIAQICVKDTEAKMRIFSKKSIFSPAEFYQIGHLIPLISIFGNKDVLSLFEASKDLLNSLNIRLYAIYYSTRISLNDIEWSEVDAFNVMKSLTLSQMADAIHLLNIDLSLKNYLKKCVIENNQENFVKTIIQHSIDYSILYIIGNVSWSQKYMSMLDPSVTDNDFDDTYLSLLKDTQRISIVPGASKIINRMVHILEMNDLASDYAILFDSNNEFLLDYIFRTIYVCVDLYNIPEEVVYDINTLYHLRTIIDNCDKFKAINNSPGIDLSSSHPVFIIKLFHHFKDHFITEMNLPKSTGQRKDGNDYFNERENVSRIDTGLLYRRLTEEGLLTWDIDTYFSFSYRMDPNYLPDSDTVENMLIPIRWNGEDRELKTLVLYFCKTTPKKWAKMAKFFLDKHGQEIRTVNGAKNSAVLTTDRMDRLLREFGIA